MRIWMQALGAGLVPLLLTGCAAPMASRAAREPVTVGIIALNDFHGNLEPPGAAVGAPDGKGGKVEVPSGGAAWLAAAIDALRAQYPNHVTVSAGDLIGASPLVSSLFLDEPTVGVMNRIGLDLNAVGNHEFDRGRDELLRMQEGGCERHTQRDSCRIEPFAGADFRFLAANVADEDGATLFPATAIRRFGDGARQVSIGFVGLTLRETAQLVPPGGIAGLSFGDEADTINREVPKLKAQGADAVVVLIHQGATISEDAVDPNGCDDLAGPILPILARLDRRVDLVVSGHTHRAYICEFGDPSQSGKPMLLTSAGSYGRLVTAITLEIDPAANRVTAREARNVIVQSPGFAGARGEVANSDAFQKFTPRADIAAYVERYADAARQYATRPIGTLSGPAQRGPSRSGGTLGNLIADAQLAATRDAGAQIALTNPFGIRADLVPAADGSLRFGQIYAAQPFGNELVTLTLTGSALKEALEQGFDDTGPEQPLAPSAGFSYAFDRKRPSGERITAMALDGQPIRPDREYRVTVNAFLAQGGDGFATIAGGRDPTRGGSDLDALEAWIAQGGTRQTPQEVRVRESP